MPALTPSVIAQPDHVSVHHERCVAQASRGGEPVWWVNRVLVQPPNARGQGIGGTLLDALIEACVDQDVLAGRPTEILVTPGGYGADPRKQVAFYKAHGFVPKPSRYAPIAPEDTLLSWTLAKKVGL